MMRQTLLWTSVAFAALTLRTSWMGHSLADSHSLDLESHHSHSLTLSPRPSQAAETTGGDPLAASLLLQWKELERLRNSTNRNPPIRTITNFIPRTLTPPDAGEDVIVCTQVSASKLGNLVTSAKYWKGPISVAVYISSREDAHKFLQDYQAHKTELAKVSFHLVMEHALPAPKFPINVLRSVAMENLGGNYFVALDVDHIPSPQAYSSLRSLLNDPTTHLAAMLQDRTLFVLPAFEVFPDDYVFVPKRNHRYKFTKPAREDQLPKTKQELVQMVQTKRAEPFRMAQFEKGQLPTQYNKWMANTPDTNNSNYYYNTTYQDKFEPYVLGYQPGIPRYWPKYRGSHNNKISWFRELNRAGYNFCVLNNAFVVHLAHPRVYNALYEEQHIEFVKGVDQEHYKYMDGRYGSNHQQGTSSARKQPKKRTTKKGKK